MTEEQIQIVRKLLEYTRALEQRIWNDDTEDIIVISAESMLIQAETDLHGESDAAPSRD